MVNCVLHELEWFNAPGRVAPTVHWERNMGSETLLTILVVGALAGWLAGLILRGSGYGLIGDIIVGLIGAFVGNWLLRAMHVAVNLGSPIADRVVVSVIGAVALMLVVALLRPRSVRERFTDVWRRR
jgi:uncharacterized membrane protein YeaQ/YmgE (transglycosylase-associated protein family)